MPLSGIESIKNIGKTTLKIPQVNIGIKSESRKELTILLGRWISEQAKVGNGWFGRAMGWLEPCLFDSIFDSVKREDWDRIAKPIWDNGCSSLYHLAIDKVMGGKNWRNRNGLVPLNMSDNHKYTELRNSLWDSIGAYLGSLFSEVKRWKYVKHKRGKYPFGAGLELWNRGYVASFDGGTWRLHNRNSGEIILTV